MRNAARALAVVMMLLLLGLPSQAEAKKSTGLYAPFPSLTASGFLQNYVGDFGVVVPRAQLKQGAVISSALVARNVERGPTPSARVEPSNNLPVGLIVGLLVALVSGGLCWTLLHWRRQS
jgi:hypothetical protein